MGERELKMNNDETDLTRHSKEPNHLNDSFTQASHIFSEEKTTAGANPIFCGLEGLTRFATDLFSALLC